MNKRITQLLTIICLAFISSTSLIGCATITSGTTQNVTVVTEKEVVEANCELTDKKGGKWFIPNTPGTVTVRKGDGPMTIICKKDGYKTVTHQIDETITAATFGNILIGGGIGILVDSMSGAAQHYPDKIVIWMEPQNFKSKEDRVAWNNAKKEYYAALEKTQNVPSENNASGVH